MTASARVERRAPAPDFIIEKLPYGLSVLRDDLIAGGTKRRGLDNVVIEAPQDDFAYAGTIFGHGALALSHAARAAGKRAHLFLSANDPAHPMVAALRGSGAIIHALSPLPIGQLHNRASAWAASNGARLFAPGFADADMRFAMAAAIARLDISAFAEIWCVAVSGTLADILRTAYPRQHIRIVSVTANAKAEFRAPEKYHRAALSPPPYPSCPYTDAKLWQFAVRHAGSGALVWNIAGGTDSVCGDGPARAIIRP